VNSRILHSNRDKSVKCEKDYIESDKGLPHNRLSFKMAEITLNQITVSSFKVILNVEI
jgi:hypothetical protein